MLLKINEDELEIKKHEVLGDLRVINKDGVIYVHAIDLVNVLDIPKNDANLRIRKLKNGCKILVNIVTNMGGYSVWFLSEQAVYTIIHYSRSPKTEVIKRWIFEEIAYEARAIWTLNMEQYTNKVNQMLEEVRCIVNDENIKDDRYKDIIPELNEFLDYHKDNIKVMKKDEMYDILQFVYDLNYTDDIPDCKYDEGSLENKIIELVNDVSGSNSDFLLEDYEDME